MQKILGAEQVAAFYHDEFVQQQVDDFIKIALPSVAHGEVVVDMGGGCGYFANAIKKTLNIPIRVIDTDRLSVEAAKNLGLEAIIGDALRPDKKSDETVVCFNLILHHLVANSEAETLALQVSALTAWRDANIRIFVNEYIYESWFRNISGWLIYQITKSKLLSAIGNAISKLLPSLKANTFGVGVRFRSNREWKNIFEKSGFILVKEQRGKKEFISFPRRLLLIKEIRRDSFLLAAE